MSLHPPDAHTSPAPRTHRFTPLPVWVPLVALLAVLSGCHGLESPPSATCSLSPAFCGPGEETDTPQTWSPSGSLSMLRRDHTATLLNSGKVLVVGGYNPHGTDGWGSIYLASAEVYDPETGTWSPTGGLATGRTGHTATLLSSGKVLVTGGGGSTPGVSPTAEVYDPETGTWSFTGSRATSLSNSTATLLHSGKVLVTGSDTVVEVYDPETGTWSRTGSLERSRNRSTATLLNSGKVLVTGGSSVTAEVYDPETGTWSRTGSLPTSHTSHTATLLLSGRVLVASGTLSVKAEVYDPEAGTWATTGSLTYGHEGARAVRLLSGKVLVVGGDGGGLGLTELYTP